MEDKLQEIENLKKLANEHFAHRRYFEAEASYTQAIEQLESVIHNASEAEVSSTRELKAVLYANRSAARLGLSQSELSLQDAEIAISSNPVWVKGYYRKAAALEALGRFLPAIETWEEAKRHCIPPHVFTGKVAVATAANVVSEDAAAIDRQLLQLKKRWSKLFFSNDFPITSEIDLLTRFSCLSDKRERLSTLAHFWNDSSAEERFSYFQLLIQLIGGDTPMSEQSQSEITSEIMLPMPMDNYVDLPRERVELWCNYFQALDGEKKALVFQSIWNKLLTSEEKNDIIMDLKVLFSDGMSILSSSSSNKKSTSSSSSSSTPLRSDEID